MVVRGTPQEPWRVIGQLEAGETHVEVEAESSVTSTTGEKRGRSPSQDDGPQTKRVRASPSAEGEPKKGETHTEPEPSTLPPARCLAPPPNETIQEILFATDANSGKKGFEGAGDIFLVEGFRERWCNCSAVRSLTNRLG